MEATKRSNQISLQFSRDDCERAYADWVCNCGPAALAAALSLTLDQVRPAVESAGFAGKRYMSPTMMRTALQYLGVVPTANRIDGQTEVLKFARRGLVRIQFEGPWTAPGSNPRWAYRHTHWVASWARPSNDWRPPAIVRAVLDPVVFDINGGLMTFDRWNNEIVPLITASIPRADDGWHVTHSWEVSE